MRKPRILPPLCLGLLLVCWMGLRLHRGIDGASAQQPARPDSVDVTQVPQGTNGNRSVAEQAESLLVSAIQTLQSCNSIAARIYLRVDLFDKQMLGSGMYLEQEPARWHRLRMDLNIQLGGDTSSLLQVCDGQYLWIYDQLAGQPKLSRIDIARVSQALQQAPLLSGPKAAWYWPSLGGLARLLQGLHGAFVFNSLQPGQLNQLPVWRLQGPWKPDRLAKLLPEQKPAIDQGKPVDLAKLPQHLPDHVVLFLGQEDLFPYRIEYLRSVPEKGRREESLDTGGLVIVAMQLSEVNLNVPIDPARFNYHPGSLKFSDQTDEFLRSLGCPEAK